MRYTITLLLLFLVFGATAQKSKARFSTSILTGLLTGERGEAFEVKTINGIAYKNWTTGVGVGLDYYHTRTIPLFLDLRRSFGKSLKAPFVYASSGINFPWLKEEESFNIKAKPGLYIDAGIGYQVPVMKGSLFFVSAGYSQKSFKEKQTYNYAIDVFPRVFYDEPTIEYTLRRLSMQIGLRF